jgi:hypothetical protein
MKALCNFMVILGLSVSSLNQSSLGSDIPIEGAFLCNIHYSRIAYDKSVKKVTAHVGVERNCTIFEATAPYWVNIQDVPLHLIADHDKFAGKAIIHFKSSTYEPCESKPMIQFWVTFDDGTTRVENPFEAEVIDSHFIADTDGPSAAEGLEKIHLFRQEDLSLIETVTCTEVVSYGNACSKLIGM